MEIGRGAPGAGAQVKRPYNGIFLRGSLRAAKEKTTAQAASSEKARTLLYLHSI